MDKSSREERRLRLIRRLVSQGEAGQEQPEAPQAGGTSLMPKRRVWLVVLFLLVCLAGSTVVSFFFFRYVVPTIPQELAGTWQVVEGGLKGSTLEFRMDGTAIATHFELGQKQILMQSVKVEGNKIFLTSKDDLTGKDETVIQTIVKLTDDELVIRDEDRRTYRMTRVGN
jgi:uncharacterized protein (TIGR03066 family)